MFCFHVIKHLTLPVCLFVAMCSHVNTVSAHHADVTFENIGGQIVAGHEHDEQFHYPQYVFTKRLNDSGETLNRVDLCMNSEDSDWPGGSRIGINILDALRVWNGTDFSEISDLAMTVTSPSGTYSVTTPSTSMEVAGFDLITSNGNWHKHPWYKLFDPTGVISDATAMPDGIYMFNFELYSDLNTVADSDPLYMLFRQDENFTDGLGTAEQLAAASAYMNSQVVPEPASVVLLLTACAAGLIAWRRCKAA